MQPEIWKPAVLGNISYLNYYWVSSYGRVKSKTRMLKLFYQTGRSYMICTLRTPNIKQRQVLVHRLVAYTFLEKPENKDEVNHIDGNPANNHISNLEWCTRKENIKHAVMTGLSSCENQRKLTNEEVLTLRDLYTQGYKKAELARKYQVNSGTIYDILEGNTYKHLIPSADIGTKSRSNNIPR